MIKFEMEQTKKISFGFIKLNKKTAVVKSAPVEQKKIELVECLEGQSIKIKDAVEVVHAPLVIPIKDNKRNLLDRVREAKAKQKELIKREVKEEDTRPDSELSIEELAARELINEAKNRLSNKPNINNHLILPVKEEKVILEGEKEPTLDDYESVPISDYGMAMLRGMGWKDGMGIGKNASQSVAPSAPELRPKGLGLGATKMVAADVPKTACDKDGKELILKRGAHAKIIAGSHKGEYCEVQGLDDEAGRVIVKTSLKNEILTLNEFLIVPVTKEEYSKGSKVLNNAKYEEYKELSDKKLERHREANSRSSDEEGGGPSMKNLTPKRLESSKEHSRSRYSSDDDKYLRIKQETECSSRKSDNYQSEKVSASDKCVSRHKSKYREKERYRSNSSSESDSERRHRKNKKNKKSRHRERSRSREAKHKKSSRSKNRASSSESEEKGRRKKNKSKSRHRRSSSDDSDHRRNKR